MHVANIIIFLFVEPNIIIIIIINNLILPFINLIIKYFFFLQTEIEEFNYNVNSTTLYIQKKNELVVYFYFS